MLDIYLLRAELKPRREPANLFITIERGLERPMQDLLVASWIAKLLSENLFLQKREEVG